MAVKNGGGDGLICGVTSDWKGLPSDSKSPDFLQAQHPSCGLK